jgi:hypothetical protein
VVAALPQLIDACSASVESQRRQLPSEPHSKRQANITETNNGDPGGIGVKQRSDSHMTSFVNEREAFLGASCRRAASKP